MASTAWKPERPENQSPQDDSSWTQRIKALTLTFYHRVRRGGIGLLLRVTGILVGLLLLYRLVPTHVSSRYRNVLSWSSPEPTRGNGLRIVAFGSQDLMGSAIDITSHRLTWPEKLCKELSCSSLLSFVPTSEYSPGLTSNGIYGNELQSLQKIAQDTDVTNNPAADYFFVNEQYPVPVGTPDLDTQIAQFLSLPLPEEPPKDTLWIFSFGTWDIWKLAAMPLQSGENVVDAMASHIFNQIESLYQQSLSPKSIAFSNFWANATKEDVNILVNVDAASTVDERKRESFRVLIPQLFDISLTPGWHNRAAPSIPHTSAEQVRNSALLTERWNVRIREQMEGWARKGNSKPEGSKKDEETPEPVSAPNPGPGHEQLPTILRTTERQKEGAVSDKNIAYAPYPQRLGLLSKPADAIVEAMMEEEMQRDGLSDTQGRGTMSDDDMMRFQDVWTPCVPTSPQVAQAGLGQQSPKCDTPDHHLFYNSFTVGQRAIDELAKLTADAVLERLIAHPKNDGATLP